MNGFVDLQVNGYAGVDFNSDHVTPEQLTGVCKRLRSDGVDQILATVITAPLDTMALRISRIAQLIDELPDANEVIAGIHIEGPFINRQTGFVGAHPVDAVRDANLDDAKLLIDAAGGHAKLVTLAPESDPGGRVTRWLSDQGIIVAAGHCDATLEQLRESLDAGLRLFTHLGNGCANQINRHDNVIQRALSCSDRLMISLIADGHHVPPFALANYLRCIPDENVVIVTDAISAAGLGPGKYELGNQIVEVDADGAAWSQCRTHFAGCAATMPEMVRVLKEKVGVSDQRIDQWTNANPRRLLGTT